MTEMRTLICPGPPEHEFKIPKARGRPPRYCSEHKPDGKLEESKVSEEERLSPRKRPGSKTEEKSPRQRPPRITPQAEKSKLDDPITEDEKTGTATLTDKGIRKLPRPGVSDTKSRAKAEAAADRAVAQQSDDAVPLGINGHPMARIEFSASELIPTGQYANVSVGPARIQAWIDLDREVDDGESFFTAQERSNLAKALNEPAEAVEHDVVTVQRNIVLESIQEQLNNGN